MGKAQTHVHYIQPKMPEALKVHTWPLNTVKTISQFLEYPLDFNLPTLTSRGLTSPLPLHPKSLTLLPFHTHFS